MRSKEEIIKRLSELWDEGMYLHNHPEGKEHKYPNRIGFEKWKVNCLSFIEITFGKNSIYYINFQTNVRDLGLVYVANGLGTINAALIDVKGDYLKKYETIINAEIFSDFLEIASHLLENNYNQPAASLIGATLEDGLRKICLNNAITLKDKEDISSLNKKLADSGIYNRLEQKKIQVWKEIRDNADHGHFDKVKREDVEDMLKGVTNFLSEYLK